MLNVVYLNFLTANRREYERYFDWWKRDLTKWRDANKMKPFYFDTSKSSGKESVWCDVCKDAHRLKTESKEERNIHIPAIQDFQKWWNGGVESRSCNLSDYRFHASKL